MTTRQQCLTPLLQKEQAEDCGHRNLRYEDKNVKFRELSTHKVIQDVRVQPASPRDARCDPCGT